MKCALCKEKRCYKGQDCTKIASAVKEEYKKEENKKVMQVAAAGEAGGYMKLTRIEELVVFCKGMGYKKVGIAFCIGLEDEPNAVHRVLEQHFEVFSVCCKVCGIDKEEFGLKKVRDVPLEIMCDPIAQATVLNDNETEVNVIIGLCVGHDMLFTKYSKAPVTTLIAKDRVMAHNPAGALYSRYYQKKLGIR
jgi:uncharacterized metal-binding protein